LVTFQRVIVMPDGQKWVEGVTPKQLPAPAPTQHGCDTQLKDDKDQ
jgi:hypothetical protein